jgi:Mg/Co/Ni transporter MgtE
MYNVVCTESEVTTVNESTIKLTNRHIAKLLTELEQGNIANIFKETIKVHMRYLAEDIEQEARASTESKCNYERNDMHGNK